MTRPYFAGQRDDVPRRGGVSSKGGLDVARRVGALEQGAGHKLAPSVYCASMYLANSGAPTHTSNGGWQHMGAGGGTDTWTSEYDYRPAGISAQVDTTTGTSRINIRRSGLYMVTGSVFFTALADGKVYACGAYVDGVEKLVDVRVIGAATSGFASFSAPLMLTVGQYVQLYAYQNDSVSEAYYTAQSYYNRLTTTLIGPPAA